MHCVYNVIVKVKVICVIFQMAPTEHENEKDVLAKALDVENWTRDSFDTYFQQAEQEAMSVSPVSPDYDRRKLLSKLRLVFYNYYDNFFNFNFLR